MSFVPWITRLPEKGELFLDLVTFIPQPSGPDESQVRHLLLWNKTGLVLVHSAAEIFGVRTQILPSMALIRYRVSL